VTIFQLNIDIDCVPPIGPKNSGPKYVFDKLKYFKDLQSEINPDLHGAIIRDESFHQRSHQEISFSVI